MKLKESSPVVKSESEVAKGDKGSIDTELSQGFSAESASEVR